MLTAVAPYVAKYCQVIATVTGINVEVADKNTPFSQLKAEDQSLITDFANIFRKEAQKRMESVLEMTA